MIKPIDIIRDGIAAALVALSAIAAPPVEMPDADCCETMEASPRPTGEKRQPVGTTNTNPEIGVSSKAAPASPVAKPETDAGQEAPLSPVGIRHVEESKPAPEVILPRPEIQATYLAACKEAARTREVLIVTYTDEDQRARAIEWLNRNEDAKRFVWLLQPGEKAGLQIHDVVSQKSRRVSKPQDLKE